MNSIENTLIWLGFPEECRKVVDLAVNILVRERAFTEIINQAKELFAADGTLDWEEFSRRAGEISREFGVDPMTGSLIFFLALVPDSRSRYERLGLSERDCRDALCDLRLKAAECYKVYHVWGTFTGWFGRFFEGTRLLCHRLQFEEESLRCDFAGLPAGSPVINIHIPELGPLTPEDCERSFALAVKAFPQCVNNGRAVFVCSSWLLSRELRTFLPSGSNILRFSGRFTVLRERTEQGFPDAWRIFADKKDLPPDKLPRTTALQRGYADYLAAHGTTTVAYGAFEYDVQ